MPTLRQLKALALIGQTGSFTRAAEKLFITQSAVSSLIRELEEEVGMPLVQRGRVISLTEAGEQLQRAGQRADLEIDRALKDLRQGGAAQRVVLRVAAGSLSSAALLPPAIARLQASDPQLKIALFDRPVGMLGDMLLQGEADVAVGSIDSPLRLSGELRSTLLFEDRIAVVCARGGSLDEQAERAGGLGWSDLHHTDLVLVGRTGGQWNLLLQDQLAAHEGLAIGHEVQLLSTALELVRARLGVAVLPLYATRHLPERDFCVAPLLRTSAGWSTYFVTRHGPPDTAKAASIERLREALRAQAPARPQRAPRGKE